MDFNFFSNVRNSRQAELIFKFRSGLRVNDKENTIEFEHTYSTKYQTYQILYFFKFTLPKSNFIALNPE